MNITGITVAHMFMYERPISEETSTRASLADEAVLHHFARHLTLSAAMRYTDVKRYKETIYSTFNIRRFQGARWRRTTMGRN